MKVGIIGATGQLGHDLMRVFGNEAVGFTHKELDITDVASLEKIKDVDYMINTAAYHKFNDCESNPIQAMNINTLGQYNVVKRCEKIGAVPVYISTDYVFSGKERKVYVEIDYNSPLSNSFLKIFQRK
ncbi:MAG: sugar nucleotide-binding protein [Thermoplasmata archaeon]